MLHWGQLPTGTKLTWTRVKNWPTIPRGLMKPVLEKCPTVMGMALGAFVLPWLNKTNRASPHPRSGPGGVTQ